MSSGGKRRDQRAAPALRVDYPAPLEHFCGDAESLPGDGIFLHTEQDLSAGERTPVRVGFPGLSEPLEVEAEVVRHRPGRAGEPPGVYVRIPGDRAEDRARVARFLEKARAGAAPARTYRVLVVEDNSHVVEMYEWALRKLRSDAGPVEVQVARAADGRLALARLARPPSIDLVISDLFMPVMDGFAFLESVRAAPELKSLPILVITAGGPGARERADDLGADLYLEKPVHSTELVEAVGSLLHLQDRGGNSFR